MAYSNEMKEKLLGVKAETLATFGAVSEPCAREMAEGVQKLCGSTLAVGITGIAGPDGGSPEKPVGTVCFACVGPGTPGWPPSCSPGDASRCGERPPTSVWIWRAATSTTGRRGDGGVTQRRRSAGLRRHGIGWGCSDRRVRSFVAVPLPSAIQTDVLAAATGLAVELPAVKWSLKAENLHVTVKFLGPVVAERMKALADALADELARRGCAGCRVARVRRLSVGQ